MFIVQNNPHYIQLSFIIHIKTININGIKDSLGSDIPISSARTIHWTERLPKTAPLWLCPQLGDKFGFAGLQNQHRDGHHRDCKQQQTQDTCKTFFTVLDSKWL